MIQVRKQRPTGVNGLSEGDRSLVAGEMTVISTMKYSKAGPPKKLEFYFWIFLLVWS
jgi:hypothetical protein